MKITITSIPEKSLELLKVIFFSFLFFCLCLGRAGATGHYGADYVPVMTSAGDVHPCHFETYSHPD